MSLHEALQALGPTTWDEIPKSQPDLRAYLSTLAHQARTIIASVPEPPPSSSHDGDEHHHKKEQQHKYGHAYTVKPSPARLGTTNHEILSLQRQWGKPLKPGNSRDNPQEIPLFKLQAGDGKATWFGRRSVHEGMPFGRWREKMSSELEETLRLNEGRVENGLAPDKVVRGLGAARRVESVDVYEEGESGGEGGKVIGGVKVYDICAHFPKPTTARDFVQASVSWEEGVDTPENGDDEDKGKGRRCRSWLSISKPCTHPELPPQDGYIRGQYDSLEFIREVPPVAADDGKSVTASDPNLAQHEGISESSEDSKMGRKRGKTDTAAEEKHSEFADGIVEDDEANPYPVEWIMVTRSDPGGSIPRWVIEKGTPKSIWGDTVKFIDWASRDDEKDDSKPSSLHSGTKGSNNVNINLNDEDEDENGEDEIHEQEQRNGLIANFAYLLNAGLERYAPQAILDYVPYQRRSSLSSDSSSEEFDDALSTASTRSSSKRRSSSKTRGGTESHKEGLDIGHTNATPVDLMQMDKKTGKLNSHEKHLAKLAQRKRDVQAKLETVRTEIEALRLDANASTGASGDEKEKETDKEKEKREKRERKEKEKQEKQEREREKKEEKEREKREKQEKRKSRKAGEEPPSEAPPQLDSTPAPDSESKSTTTSNNQPPSSEDLPRLSERQERPKHNRTVSTASHRSAAQIHKAASGLFAQESKLLKQLGKIEQDQLKEASKIEARQKKQVEKEEKSRSRMEMDGMKKEVDELKKEVEKLRNERQQWQDLVASLQGENQRLGGQGGQVEAGG